MRQKLSKVADAAFSTSPRLRDWRKRARDLASQDPRWAPVHRRRTRRRVIATGRPSPTYLERPPNNARHSMMERRSRIIRITWAACLLLAALNHARILAQHGLSWDYGGVGAASTFYWSVLTIVDPIAAALLIIRPTVGIPLTVALITTNGAHNLAITAMFSGEGEFLSRAVSSWAIISQVAFMLFVMGTAPPAWRGRTVSWRGQSAQLS